MRGWRGQLPTPGGRQAVGRRSVKEKKKKHGKFRALIRFVLLYLLITVGTVLLLNSLWGLDEEEAAVIAAGIFVLFLLFYGIRAVFFGLGKAVRRIRRGSRKGRSGGQDVSGKYGYLQEPGMMADSIWGKEFPPQRKSFHPDALQQNSRNISYDSESEAAAAYKVKGDIASGNPDSDSRTGAGRIKEDRIREDKTKTGRFRLRSMSKRILLTVGAAAVVLVALFAGSRRISRQSGIPQSLLALKQKYPETASFVDHYPENINKKQVIDLSGEIQPGSIPLFIQWDERWGYETYGSDFLAVTGCGPTCISMVYCGLTGDSFWNPYEVAKFSQEHDYYVPGEGTSWNLMTEGAQLLGLNAEYGSVNADYIFACLWQGCPLICSMYPGDFTYTGHFIVLTGTDESGRIVLNDPNSKSNSAKHWDMDVLLPQIRSLWKYNV